MIYLSLVEYVLHKFLTGICVVSSIRKIVSLLKIFDSVKLYHETDCNRFDEINKTIVESLWDRNLTQGTTKNICWTFSQEHTHPLIETSSRRSCNS